MIDLKKASPQERDKALCVASETGNLRRVEACLAAGADVHYRFDYALRNAAAAGFLEVSERLISAGADINAFGGNPLGAAMAGGNAAIVALLLAAGANIPDEVCLSTPSLNQMDPGCIRTLRAAGARLRVFSVSSLADFLDITPSVAEALLSAGPLETWLDPSELARRGGEVETVYAMMRRYVEDYPGFNLLIAMRALDTATPAARAQLIREASRYSVPEDAPQAG